MGDWYPYLAHWCTSVSIIIIQLKTIPNLFSKSLREFQSVMCQQDHDSRLFEILDDETSIKCILWPGVFCAQWFYVSVSRKPPFHRFDRVPLVCGCVIQERILHY